MFNMRSLGSLLLSFSFLFLGGCKEQRSTTPRIHIASFADEKEAKRLLTRTISFPKEKRVLFISKYFKGRKYRPETKKRIKKQRSKPKTKKEATNRRPLPIETLSTSFTYLDCMTYVEHVLALAATEKADYVAFLRRLVDVMGDGQGQRLMNHHRSHFTSHWADVNERKGYLVNVARGHKAAKTRVLTLNKVGENRTFYIEDRFMISQGQKTIHYFPKNAILAGKADLQSGDVVAMVCDKEGLDVLHMGFYVRAGDKKLLRHASYKDNRVKDQDFTEYLEQKGYVKGLMVLRPKLAAKEPFPYEFLPRKR